MMQLNLLPDVKLKYLKAVRTKRLTISVSVIASAAALFILIVLLATVYIFQRKSLNDVNNDIATYTQKVQSTPHLNQMLTVQNQLKSLPSLHDQKPVATRLFDYVKQLTPAKDSITDLQVDFTADTMSIQGSAPSLDNVNTFVDTLKYTKYQVDGDSSTEAAAFSNVVLSQFSTTSKNTDFTITLSYDPAIFDSTKNVQLNVPNIVTTRVGTQTTDLFQNKPKESQ